MVGGSGYYKYHSVDIYNKEILESSEDLKRKNKGKRVSYQSDVDIKRSLKSEKVKARKNDHKKRKLSLNKFMNVNIRNLLCKNLK